MKCIGHLLGQILLDATDVQINTGANNTFRSELYKTYASVNFTVELERMVRACVRVCVYMCVCVHVCVFQSSCLSVCRCRMSNATSSSHAFRQTRSVPLTKNSM